MKTFTGDTWRIELPDDWQQKEASEQGVLFFETTDLTKGLYLAAWDLGPAEKRSAPDIARTLSDTGAQALDGTLVQWEKVGDGAGETAGVATVLTDHFAARNSYRIITKVVARRSIAVRAAFHDYACENYAASTGYFTPIVDSLALL
jgi:hypothetical protein